MPYKISPVILFLFISLFPCNAQVSNKVGNLDSGIRPAADNLLLYLPELQGKKVAVVANQTSLVGKTYLVDTLISCGVDVVKIFGPEHGFRGEAADGALIEDAIDSKTGVPVVSLYGDHRKPTSADLVGLDLILFDIQDVGCRFFTYISTMSNVMEACAEKDIPMIILDRPNPNGYYVDGPILEPKYASFVGLHPVPIVYGMTIGEYALMANGEKWLKNGIHCNLTVIPCSGYTHSSRYQLPVKPSPNLPAMESVYLYPSLCLFEGTSVSIGRGTEKPFTMIGHPLFHEGSFMFTPKAIPGVSDNPPFKGKVCYGQNLETAAIALREHGHIELGWLKGMYKYLRGRSEFFTPYFDKLAGTASLRKQIEAGMSPKAIRKSWQKGIREFMPVRAKYLLYPDFQ
jgi:uncharacterized protein YbbC (DUF1343 family)